MRAELAASLSPDVVTTISRYTPRLLTCQQWDRVHVQARDAVAAAQPGSTSMANLLLSSLCRFLSWTDPLLGSLDLDEVLTAENVRRWTITNRRSDDDQTAASIQTRLHRLMQARAGELPLAPHGPRPPGPAPYTSAELQALMRRSRAADGPQLAVAIGLGVGWGLIAPAAYQRQAPQPPTAAGDEPAPQLPAAIHTARQLLANHDGVDLDHAAWQTARQQARRSRVPLVAGRLRATWLQALLSTGAPAGVLARAHALTRADLNNVLPHLAAPDPDSTRRLLRG
jgi:hypothetical protein